MNAVLGAIDALLTWAYGLWVWAVAEVPGMAVALLGHVHRTFIERDLGTFGEERVMSTLLLVFAILLVAAILRAVIRAGITRVVLP
ncbi:hypothetical protein [Microbacterium sp. NPDC055683]